MGVMTVVGILGVIFIGAAFVWILYTTEPWLLALLTFIAAMAGIAGLANVARDRLKRS